MNCCEEMVNICNNTEKDWMICPKCLFICIPSHFIRQGGSYADYHYIIPIGVTKIYNVINFSGVENEWYYILDEIKEFVCSCGKNCEPKNKDILSKPFKIKYEISENDKRNIAIRKIQRGCHNWLYSPICRDA
jgi:hypothetical protein